MRCLYHTSNTINLVTSAKYTAFGIMKYRVFVQDLIDCSAAAHGIIFAKYVMQITKQQGRYAVGHGWAPLGNRASLSRCMHRRKVAALPYSWCQNILTRVHGQSDRALTMLYRVLDASFPLASAARPIFHCGMKCCTDIEDSSSRQRQRP